MLKTPAGRPASTNDWVSRRPDSGASDDGLYTTALPATRAPPAGPPDSANGKLNGLMTPHTPYGLRTERVWTAASPRLPIGSSKPWLRSIMSHDQRMRSAVSSTSPSASSRFLPTSIARSAPNSICRSLMMSAARRSSATRSRHGRRPQAGKAARAAAIASWTSLRLPLAKVPMTDPSIGVRFSNVPSPSRQAPPT